MTNKIKGRWCPLYPDEEWEKEIGDDLPDILYEQYEKLKTDKIDIISRRIGKGICLLGIGLANEFIGDINLIMACLGGQMGTDLIQMPYEGGVLDQPARLMRVFEIVKSEIGKYQHAKLERTNSRSPKQAILDKR